MLSVMAVKLYYYYPFLFSQSKTASLFFSRRHTARVFFIYMVISLFRVLLMIALLNVLKLN